jgi:hypothetical protein
VTRDLLAGWRVAQLAEIAWVDPDGSPHVRVVVPLLEDGAPTLALPYAELHAARSLAATDRATFCLAVPGVTGGSAPVAAAARIEVVEDPRGERFVASALLDQVVAKHPPARRRLDSILLRREHGWYVPRVLVRTLELGPSFDIGTGEALGVAATGDGGPWVAMARDASLSDGTARLEAPDGPAVLLQHGADVPALETPWHRRWQGTVWDGRFSAEDRDEVAPARRRPTLRERIRAERDLERACKDGLREAGHR